MRAASPTVALVGRPNVGKSSLFNRLVGGRPALVEDVPGVTRDRRYGACAWDGQEFQVVDTGGLDPDGAGILAAMRTQTLRAIDDARVLVLVLDAGEGVTAVDEEVARLLRRTGKTVLVAVNKVDSSLRDASLAEGYALGFTHVFGLSATHGRGVADLLDAIVAALGLATSGGAEEKRKPSRSPREDHGSEELPESITKAAAELPIRLAFVGKPNAGKSSLVNRLLGEERVLVHDQPGTTRDPIDTPFSANGREFVLVDTAGLRRRRAIFTHTEAVAAKMARDQLARADVVALVIDATLGASAEDAKLASFIEESGRGAIVILNKMDLVPRVERDRVISAARETLSFLGWAALLPMSAHTGRGTEVIVSSVAHVYGQWSRRVPTAELNKSFAAIVERRLPPAGPSGRHVKLYFVSQVDVRPPTFFVSTNMPNAIGHPYRRYLANELRKAFGFDGSPLRLALREHRRKRKVPA